MKLSLLFSLVALAELVTSASGLDRRLSKSKRGSKAVSIGGWRERMHGKMMKRKMMMTQRKPKKKPSRRPVKRTSRIIPPTAAPNKQGIPPRSPPSRAPQPMPMVKPTPAPARQPTPIPAVPQPDYCKDANDYNGHKYLMTGGATWDEARKEAESLKCCNVFGYLAAISTADEGNFIAKHIMPAYSGLPAPHWIGLWAPQGSGSDNTYTNEDFNWTNGEVYNGAAYSGFPGGVPTQVTPGNANYGGSVVYMDWCSDGKSTCWTNDNFGGSHDYIVEFPCS
jgi:hypothetical protein